MAGTGGLCQAPQYYECWRSNRMAHLEEAWMATVVHDEQLESDWQDVDSPIGAGRPMRSGPWPVGSAMDLMTSPTSIM